VTSTVTLRPSRCTFKVILLSWLSGLHQAESLLRRTYPRPGPPRARCFMQDPG
jgi:hypothetical protein